MHIDLRIIILIVAGVLANLANAQTRCPGKDGWVFEDVEASDAFCPSITWMAQNGVTLGCATIDANRRLYCGADPVLRSQMAAFMKRLSDAMFPSSCAVGQVLKYNGTAWACADDANTPAGGTVTSVMAGTGLEGSPNPITSSGSLNLAPTYQLPQGCGANQVPKWSGSTWSCGTDGVGGTGTVTSVTAGIGLSGGTITSTGTIAADLTALQARVSSSCPTGSSIRAIAADGAVTCHADVGTPLPANVLWVAQSGAAFNTITAAMSYAATHASAANPFLIKVAPGTYTERIVLEDHVQIEGSGRGITTITSTAQAGTVLASASAGSELRRLSIHNASTSNTPYAVFGMPGSALRLVDVALSTYNASASLASTISTSGTVELLHSSVDATGPGGSFGVFGNTAASITIRDSEIVVQADSTFTFGVSLLAGTLHIANSRITASSTSGSASALRASGSSIVEITSATITAAAHSSGFATAVFSDVAATVRVKSSVLDASGGALNTSAQRAASSLLRIAYSELRGNTSGTPACIGNYDASLTPVACP